ncbi:MAG TPA: hypothetical protein GX505_06770 [Clostridiales bacterium]|nr:hypothetical protein [Clostridiales bacterium]
MKQIKLYNVIFPVWLILFFPPVIFITLAGNFIFDSLIVIASYFLFRPHKELNWLVFYKKSIIRVWLFGFLADIIGAVILFACVGLQDFLGLSNEVIRGISFDPFSNVLSIILILLSVLISGLCIILFNYNYTFNQLIEEELPRWKVSIFIAVTTLPWTFLLPTKWFY